MSFKKILLIVVIVVLSSCDTDHNIYYKGFSSNMSWRLGWNFYTSDITPTSATVDFDCTVPIGMDYRYIGLEYREINSYTSWKQVTGIKSGYTVKAKLSNLTPSTTYEVRACIRTDENTFEGQGTSTFTTLSNATIKLEDVVDNTSSSYARVYFTTSSTTTFSEIGYCISENHNPTITNRKEYRSNSKSFYDYSSVDKGKIFYARPYTKDSQGNIYYGEEVSFNTIAITNNLTVSDAKYQAKYVDGTYYYYHYTLEYSFSYYGDNLDVTYFYISNSNPDGSNHWHWNTTYTGERSSKDTDVMCKNNPSPFEYYAYARLKDGSYVYGIHKYRTVSF